MTPRICTEQVPASITKNIYNRRKVTAVDMEEVAGEHGRACVRMSSRQVVRLRGNRSMPDGCPRCGWGCRRDCLAQISGSLLVRGIQGQAAEHMSALSLVIGVRA